MLSRKTLHFDYFEYSIYLLYSLFVELKTFLFLPIIVLKRIYNFFKFIFYSLKFLELKNLRKYLMIVLKFFMIQHIENTSLTINFLRITIYGYIFCHKKKLKYRKELILHFKEVEEQEYQKCLKEIEGKYKPSFAPMYLYPKELEKFFIKYRFIKMIGFYNYFVKGKRDVIFNS